MREMTGVEFLSRAMKVYPESKRVLLAACGNTKTATCAINKATFIAVSSSLEREFLDHAPAVEKRPRDLKLRTGVLHRGNRSSQRAVRLSA